ncbi:phosphatidate cytidylyltransferase [Alcaligenaceae bacterium]|nr:phosphatidate cytidylyltransferase [Alcaligenaceae bacterium]
MLLQRVLTAIVLLLVLFGALMASSPWPLVVLLVVLAGCALWEWLRLSLAPAWQPAAPWVAVFTSVVMCWLVWTWMPSTAALPAAAQLVHPWFMPVAAAAWAVLALPQVLQGRTDARRFPALMSTFGVLAVVSAWAALVLLFIEYGAWCLVSMMALIWFADIAAYFTGRAFGRRKLAPAVSPGKTWEGAAGGILAAAVWTTATAAVPGSFGAILAQQWSLPVVFALACLLAAISIVGDLFESLLKRRAGVKDSSRLLPGHGGVYDRIDALLPVAPVAIMLTGTIFR